MELYLIRHAESENNARPSYERVEDPPITAVGRLQAEQLASWLSTLRADALITSPFLRTLETVRPVLAKSDHSLRVWHNVFERGGCYRGWKASNFQGAMGLGRGDVLRMLGPHAEQTELDPTIDESGWWGGKPRETDDEAVRRAKEVCERLCGTFQDQQRVLLLIHADLKRLLLSEMLCDSIDVMSLGPIRNVGITKVNRLGDRWQLDYFNSVTHLPAKLITGNEH
ncbi:MAG: histidine phosphatase family protein [Planctomycetota bacterium]